MIRNSIFFLGFLLISASLGAQSLFSKKLEGRVYSKDGDVSATTVQNISTDRATITDFDGFFQITANLNDTLVFSAVQFKKQEIVVSREILQQRTFNVYLEDALTELDEVVVTPYNLTGDITKDIDIIKTDPVVTSSTLELPNAYVLPITKAERELFEATSGSGLIPLNPILNGISGRTKMLKKRIARNKLYSRTERVKEFYPDSLFRTDLKIPETKIDDLLYFCEVDQEFQKVVDTHDRLKIWEFIRKKSLVYRKNNDLD
ncbi:carboxypeptidase-like regulatory domain-containing protein [Maribacter sp. 2308TA10-17]|uniref:carboxypeptidase-like regulatory domain-containing protein n=1 Tax=Maribacter sp. 2308TA10-17 TaxID=3386276 RepID=UPI0039BD28EA